jgi:hypothetical protein
MDFSRVMRGLDPRIHAEHPQLKDPKQGSTEGEAAGSHRLPDQVRQ